MNLPCMRDKCIGKACGNFGAYGCKGGELPPRQFKSNGGEIMPYKTVEEVIDAWLKTKSEGYQKFVKQCDFWEPARFEYYEIIEWLLSQINNKGENNERR